MLDALLELARLGTVPLQRAAVPPVAMVQEVAAERCAAYPTRQVVWQIAVEAADVPDIQSDPVLLRLAIQHVLDNTIKFTASAEPAVISVSAKVDGANLRLEAQDNGVGFNPALQSRQFQAFSRLHSQRQFEGLGMGLALTAKIMQRLGGAVQVQGAVDGGCRVTLSLPCVGVR